jgi:hypothetical protein
MKKIVRLTESDLVKLVKRVIKEQQTSSLPAMSVDEATQIQKYINSSGSEYVGTDFGIKKDLTMEFMNRGQKPGQGLIVNLKPGDRFNVAAEQMTNVLADNYSLIVVTANNQRVPMTCPGGMATACRSGVIDTTNMPKNLRSPGISSIR